MKNNPARLLIVIIIIIFYCPSAIFAQFYSMETENLRLIYFGMAHSYVVKHAGRCFENSFNFHQKLYNYTPSEKITILLHDVRDYGNAGAGVEPTNHIFVAIAPSSYVFETLPSNERINSTTTKFVDGFARLDARVEAALTEVEKSAKVISHDFSAASEKIREALEELPASMEQLTEVLWKFKR